MFKVSKLMAKFAYCLCKADSEKPIEDIEESTGEEFDICTFCPLDDKEYNCFKLCVGDLKSNYKDFEDDLRELGRLIE